MIVLRIRGGLLYRLAVLCSVFSSGIVLTAELSLISSDAFFEDDVCYSLSYHQESAKNVLHIQILAFQNEVRCVALSLR